MLPLNWTCVTIDLGENKLPLVIVGQNYHLFSHTSLLYSKCLIPIRFQPSANYPVTFCRLVQSVPLGVIFGFGREGGGRMKYLGEYIDVMHKRLAPFKHWFLQIIGVDPEFQGKGYAGKLLRPMLSRIDEEGLACYLETLDERNVLLYEHFGFRVVGKSTIPETSLTSWAMLREVQ